MPGLGPRVGGAHVDVNMKFDDKSVDTVGKRIQKQLSGLNKSLTRIGNQNRRLYRAIGKDAVFAWRSLLGTIVTSAPIAGSAISGITGAATLLVGSLYSVSQASAGLLPIFTSLGVAGLTLSIGMNNFFAAVAETDTKRLEKLLKGMPKSMQDAVMSTRKLANEMRAALWPKLFAGLSDGIESLRKTGVIQRGLGKMADSINGLVKSVLAYANTKAGISTLNKFFTNNAKVFAALSKAVVPFLDGFLRLVNALTPAAIRLSGHITDIAKRFQGWTKGEGFAERINKSMKKAEKTSGLLFKVIGNLGSAFRNIFNITNPSTNTFLQMLVDATQRFEDFTNSAKGKNQIVEWANQSIEVMRQFGKTIGAGFELIAKLSDSRVIVSFLQTVQGAFEHLKDLPLDKIIDGYVKLAQALQPVSSWILALIVAEASLNIITGNLMGQLGGFVSLINKFIQFKILTSILKKATGQTGATGAAAEGAAKKTGLLSRAWGFLVRIFQRIGSVFKRVLGFFTGANKEVAVTTTRAAKLGKAFSPFLSVLGKIAKFAGAVGLVVWIGVLIAKSKTLQEKFGKVWDAIKGVGKAFADGFKEIKTALVPLSPAADKVGSVMGKLFTVVDKLATIAIGAFLDVFIDGLKGLAQIITGVARIIAGVINVIVGLFTGDFSKMWTGIKQIFSGALTAIIGLIRVWFTVSFFKIVGLGFSLVRGAATRGFVALRGLFGKGIKAFGGIVKRIGEILLKPFRSAFNGLVSLVKGSWNKVRGLTSAAWNGIKNLLGKVVSALPDIVQKGITKVVGFIEGLPKKFLSLVKRFLDAGKQLGSSVIQGIKNGLGAAGAFAASVATGVGDKIKDAINGLVDRLNSAIPNKLGWGKFAIDIPDNPVPHLARGTRNFRGGLAMTGEFGRELVALPAGSRVFPHRQTEKILADGGDKKVELHLHYPTPEKPSVAVDRLSNLSFLLGG